jgi:hypothetical protein
MANKYFNKQVAESRKPLASGSMVKAISEFNKPHNLPPKDYKKSTSKELKALEGFRKVSPKPLDNIRSKGDKMKEYLIGNKEFRDKLRKKKSDMRTNKKTYAPEWKHNPKITKASESPERKKRQADYMKKHGKNEPSRKTLSVKNSYKKEVEGLK